MTHLTVEEIIEFVSFNKITNDTLALSSMVNEHIRSCPKCMENVSAFQMVYDELCRIGNVADVKQCIYQMIDEGELKNLQDSELEQEIQSANDKTMSDINR